MPRGEALTYQNEAGDDMFKRWGIQDEATGQFVEYLGDVPRWGTSPQTWKTYRDAVISFDAFHKALNENCRVVEVS